MTLLPLVLAAGLVALLWTSVRRPAAGVFGLVLLVPLYYVIRGMGGQTAFVFVWPYLYTAAYLHVLSVKGMAARPQPRAAWNGVYAGYIVLAALLLISFGFVRDALTAPLPQVITQFNDFRVVLMGAAIAWLIVWPLAWMRPRSWSAALTAADWIVIAFIGYGLVQVLLSVARTGHVFYTLESFRYYFAMAVVYFAARFGLQTDRDVLRLAVALVAAGFMVAVEYIAEHVLFNAGVSSLALPWLAAFDAMFPGYGRPMPVDGFYIVTDYTESHYIPYSGTRAIGLILHPHTAGFFAAMIAALVIPPLFDRKFRYGGWLSLLIGLFFYASLLTISRSAVMLFYVVLAALPIACAWLLRDRFAGVRLLPYMSVIALALAAASFWSPGGRLPYLTLGWYERPMLFASRAVMGDMLAWRTTEQAENARRTDAGPSQGASPSQGAAPGPAPRRAAPEHSTTAPGEALGVAAGVISDTSVKVLVLGAGFSPLTRYVNDYFPEAAKYRHVTSTSDVALLEFFQQFGGVGLALLIAMFGVFVWEGVVLAKQFRDGWIGQFGLAAAAAALITLISMLHLYPLFRIGVNTCFFAMLGGLGYLRAMRLKRAPAAGHV